MSVSGDKGNPLKNVLLKVIECPICADTMRSPIVLCESGHSICQNCREKVQVCPICKGDYPGIRNRLAEDIATHISLQRCRNECRGCVEMLPPNEIEAHEAECPFRLHLCRMCKVRFTLQ